MKAYFMPSNRKNIKNDSYRFQYVILDHNAYVIDSHKSGTSFYKIPSKYNIFEFYVLTSIYKKLIPLDGFENSKKEAIYFSSLLNSRNSFGYNDLELKDEIYTLIIKDFIRQKYASIEYTEHKGFIEKESLELTREYGEFKFAKMTNLDEHKIKALLQ